MDDPLADAKASARMTGLVQGIDGKLHSLTALSEGLSVGGNLDLNRTKITALPEGLKVGGKIFGGPKPPRGSIGAEAARTLRYLVVR
jgi:hypothetical protein